MLYPKSSRYDTPALRAMMMGPNPVKLLEELMAGIALAPEAHVCDLGCGRGLTSVFLAREYGLRLNNSPLKRAGFDPIRTFQTSVLPPICRHPDHETLSDAALGRSEV